MSHHFTPGRLQVSLTPYQEQPRPRSNAPQNSNAPTRAPYAPTVTRSPYTPGNNNTVPRARNPGPTHTPVRTIFGVRIRNPLSPNSSPGPQSPFGPTLRFRYPPTTPTTPTASTPFGPALRPRTPSQGFHLSPTTPSSPSPFGPTLRTRSPSPLPQAPSPRPGYSQGSLNRSSSALSLHQYPNSPGTLNRNSSYEPEASNRNPSMNRGSYQNQTNGYRNSTATLNRIPSYEGNNYNYARQGAATLNPTSYQAANSNRNFSGTNTLSQYPAKSMHQINRNSSSASKFSRKASYDAPLPVFPPAVNRSPSKESSPTPPKQIIRSPSVTSTKRKGPNTNKGSILLSDAENQEIYSILGKGRQTLSSAVVQLLFPSPDNEHRWKLREVGVLCFVRDSTKKSYFLEVISLRMRRVIFSQEIYEEFDYRMPRPRYLTFEGDGFRVGISFANQDESSDFKEILDQKIDAKRQRRIDRQTKQYVQSTVPTPNHQNPVKSQTPQAPPPLNRMQHHWNGNSQAQSFTIDPDAKAPEPVVHNITLPPAEQKSKKSKLTFYKSKGKTVKPSKNGKPGKLDKSAIGAPMDFKHLQHAGFDPKRGGFVSDGIDESKYLKLLEEAGLGFKAKDLLQDRDTRQYIYNFVEDYEQSVSNPSTPAEIQNHSSSSVPPPPSKMQIINKPSSAPNPPPVPNRAPGGKGNAAANSVPPPPPFPGNMAAKPPTTPHQQNRTHHQAPTPPTSSNGPPPPPPFPSSTLPPPPPPPPMPSELVFSNRQEDQDSDSSHSDNPISLPTKDDGRSDLMKQIQQAKLNTLKKVDPNSTGRKPKGGMSDVFSEIRNAPQLKKTDESDRAMNKSPEAMDGLAGALARALAERSKAINPESSGSEDNDQFESDSEWDD